MSSAHEPVKRVVAGGRDQIRTPPKGTLAESGPVSWVEPRIVAPSTRAEKRLMGVRFSGSTSLKVSWSAKSLPLWIGRRWRLRYAMPVTFW